MEINYYSIHIEPKIIFLHILFCGVYAESMFVKKTRFDSRLFTGLLALLKVELFSLGGVDT